MRFKRTFFFRTLPVLVVSGLASCGFEPSDGRTRSEACEPYRIVCTVGMIADVVRHVAGDLAEVENVIGEGIDPHLYKPTRSAVVKLYDAEVIFYNGLLLEGKMAGVLAGLANQGKTVEAVAESVLEKTDYPMREDEASADPHLWMDVRGWIRAVSVIADTLSRYDSLRAETYRANARAYAEDLEALDAYAAKALATIPQGRRTLVTAHDAFNYMGRAYGFEVRGIQGVSTESEAGLRDLEKLVDFVVENKIPAVFVETSVADKNVRALIEGAGARGHTVVIGGKLFSDAMGKSGTYEGTYIGMIDHNVTVIANALGGTAQGFQSYRP